MFEYHLCSEWSYQRRSRWPHQLVKRIQLAFSLKLLLFAFLDVMAFVFVTRLINLLLVG